MKQNTKLLFVALLVGALVQSAFAAGRKPNIIYIMLDDAGYGDLSCYGQKKFKTPNVDRLAKEGMKFTDHYSGSTVCAPTRCALMTGLHTGHCFVRGNKEVQPEGQWPMPADTVTVPRLLKKAGYTTGMFGKWGLGSPASSSDPTAHFDTFFGYNCQRQAHTYYPGHLWSNNEKVPLDGETYSEHMIHDATLKFIRDNAKKTFFAYVPITIPHAAMHAPEEDTKPWRAKFPEFEATTGKYGKHKVVTNPVAKFAAMMTLMDRGVGEIITLLKDLKIEKNTVVMFTSDNGPHREGGHKPDFFNSNGPLKGYKRDLYEGGIRAPLICWWPGKIKAGKTSDHICAHWDLLPTACEIAGIKAPAKTDGISYLPTLLGQTSKQKKHEYLYWEFHERGKKQAVRIGKWKGIRQNLAKNRNAPIELYNLSSDVGEENNVAGQHADIVGRMKTLFRTARVESDVFTLFPAKNSKKPGNAKKPNPRKK
ncbi:MAG: arylsulfatase A-like enzyme [Limisphaerales bacterium]|jgi:arylsulfatase A